MKERRVRRAHTFTQALAYQLDACCQATSVQAMVVADGDGLALASSGEKGACDEIAARVVIVGSRIREFNGTLLGAGGCRWDVQMMKVDVDGTDLLVCAVGGTAEDRRRQITRGAEGARRILSLAA